MAMEDTAATEVKAEAEASAEHSQQDFLSFSDDEIVRAATPVREQDLHSVPSNKHCSLVAARAHCIGFDIETRTIVALAVDCSCGGFCHDLSRRGVRQGRIPHQTTEIFGMDLFGLGIQSGGQLCP